MCPIFLFIRKHKGAAFAGVHTCSGMLVTYVVAHFSETQPCTLVAECAAELPFIRARFGVFFNSIKWTYVNRIHVELFSMMLRYMLSVEVACQVHLGTELAEENFLFSRSRV